MRALHLISSAGVYGAERMVISLVKGLQALGCEPVIEVFRNSQNPHTEVADILRAEGFPVTVIPCRSRWDVQALRQIRRSIRQQNIDIVHTHGYKADIYGFLATRLSRTPVVATCHNWTNASSALTTYARLDRCILRYFHKLAAVSDDVAQKLRQSRIRNGKVVTIANGIPTADYAAAAAGLKSEMPRPGQRIIGMVGRLVPEKGIPTLLEAARNVLRSFPDTTFALVGDGPFRAEFESQAQQYGIADHVLFTGWRRDMPGVYRSFDIFVLPSWNEGLPMSVLEAMAAGVPVVATPVGALPKIIEDGRTGLMVEPGDVGQLTAALERLLSDPQFGAHLAHAAGERVREQYSSESMAKRYLGMYREAFGVHAQGATA